MRVVLFILYCLIAFLPEISIANDENFDLSQIPIQQCSFQKVNSILISKSLKRSVMLAKNSGSPIEEINEIANKATDHTKSIGAQLSVGNLDKLSSASQRLQTIQMEEFIEGDVERDLLVVDRLVKLSDNYYRWNKIPTEKDKDNLLLFSILLGVKEIIPSKDFKLKKPSQIEKCSLDYALFNLEIEPLTKYANLKKDFISAMTRVNQIYVKYENKEKNYSYFNNEDKKEISLLRNKFIFPAMREIEFIQNIEIVRRYAKMSGLIYKTCMSDVLYFGGDINKIGSSMEAKIKGGKLGTVDVFIYGMWKVIKQKIPSETFKFYKQASEILLANKIKQIRAK